METLGLGMIVRNEPMERVAALVDLVSPLLSQAVILDTGSVTYERDREIASTWDFKVEYDQMPWRPDFAGMRNETIDRMHTDWYLQLDADELPSLGMMGALRRITESCESQTLGWLVFTKNFWAGERGIEVEAHWHCRLFRTSRGRYYKQVHEQVMLDNRQEPSTRGTLVLPKMNKEDYLIHAKPLGKLDESARIYSSIS